MIAFSPQWFRDMSSLVLTLMTCFVCVVTQAQHHVCGTDQLHQQLMLTDTAYAENFIRQESLLTDEILSPISHTSDRDVIFIPIVVHVIHLGEPIGTGSNISDQQIYEAIYGLNARFNNWIGAGVDVDFVFTFAKRDPYGCATDGINRVDGRFTFGYSSSGIGYGGAFCIENDTYIKDLSRWPTLEYYNIWVVHKVCDGWLSGYASYPIGNPYDGTVLVSSEMTQTSYSLTHEVGHGFNLIHTFEGASYPMCPPDTNCLVNGDKICDTPPHRQSDCDMENPCSIEGDWDNSRYNYMSYCEPEESTGRFTQNQKDRMIAAMDVFPRSFLSNSIALDAPDTVPCVIQPFITTWNTSNPGSFGDSIIYFPGKGINYKIAWEMVSDTTIKGSRIAINDVFIHFPAPGIYRIMITPGTGTFDQIEINNEYDRKKLVSIDQWGDILWTSMENAFYGCSNMIMLATDVPNLGSVTSMQNMFNGCSLFTGDIGNWRTDHVRNMESMFEGAGLFNQNIGNWNTSAVTRMADMFKNASTFNQDIGDWNIANVFTLSGMFYKATSFNQPIGQWNTTKVSSMREMFYDADAFNQDIGDWNTSNVTDISLMFEKTNSFNQDITRWNTSKVRFMLQTFRDVVAFNQDISIWNTSNVISMIQMFYNATSFNQDLGSWTLNPTVNMLDMLVRCGMTCENYSGTLIGWQANNHNVVERKVAANNLKFGTNALAARNALTQDQLWEITGDKPSGVACVHCSLTATINDVPSTCGLDNGQLVVDASGGDDLSFIWNMGDTTSSIYNLSPGIYTVTISDQNGCTLEQSSQIDSSNSISIEFTFDEPTLFAQPEGGKEPLHFLWNTGDTTSSIEPLTTGEYSVTVSDADSCQVIDTFYVLLSSVTVLSESIKIYPNPVRYQLFIESPDREENILVTLYDMNGRSIWNGSLHHLEHTGLNVADLPNGVYYLKAKTQHAGFVALITKL